MTTYYELPDLVLIAALASTAAYLTGRAHAERAAERARQRRRAHRLNQHNRNNTKERNPQ